MRKILPALFLILAGAITTHAQSTTVSGTVTDAGSQAWANGPFKFVFQPNPQFPTGPYTWTGGALNTVITGTLDGSGHYSVSIPSNSAITPAGSTWILQVTPDATSPSFSTPRTTITGGTQTLNATPPAIAINWNIPPGPAISAYADGEITGTLPKGAEYFNVTSGFTRVWNGSAWANQGGGGGGTCPAGTAGEIQFTNGTGCADANGIFAGAIARMNPLTGDMEFAGGAAIGFNASAPTSSLSFNSGTGGMVINTQGTLSSDSVAGINFLTDSGNLQETATVGSITRTAPVIADTVADASPVTPGSVTQRVVSITSDTILSTDRQNRVVYNSASAVEVTLPTEGSAGFGGGFNARLSNQMPGVVTVTPATGTINGNATLVLNEGDDCFLTPSATGPNWAADCNPPQLIAGANVSLTRGVHSLTIGLTGLSPAPATLTPTANLFVTGYTQSTGAWTTGQVIGNSINGALSTPAYTLSGTAITGGTGTTTTPLWLYNCTGATAVSTWSTSGTIIGINPCTGFTGNAIDIHAVNGGGTVFNVSASGGVVSAGSIFAAAGSAIGMNARTVFRSAADGRIAVNDNANVSGGINRFTFGTEAANNPALFFDGSTASIYAADGTGSQAAGIFGSAQYVTPSNCLQSVSPAACGANITGRVALAAAATTLVVNTTKVTANSEIHLQRDDSLGAALSITCNTQSGLVLGTPRVTARTAGTSFTITVDAAPTTNPLCMTYLIFN